MERNLTKGSGIILDDNFAKPHIDHHVICHSDFAGQITYPAQPTAHGEAECGFRAIYRCVAVVEKRYW
jgi:hypothetical protein